MDSYGNTCYSGICFSDFCIDLDTNVERIDRFGWRGAWGDSTRCCHLLTSLLSVLVLSWSPDEMSSPRLSHIQTLTGLCLSFLVEGYSANIERQNKGQTLCVFVHQRNDVVILVLFPEISTTSPTRSRVLFLIARAHSSIQEISTWF